MSAGGVKTTAMTKAVCRDEPNDAGDADKSDYDCDHSDCGGDEPRKRTASDEERDGRIGGGSPPRRCCARRCCPDGSAAQCQVLTDCSAMYSGGHPWLMRNRPSSAKAEQSGQQLPPAAEWPACCCSLLHRSRAS